MTHEVMKELGVNISHQRLKDIQEFLGQAFDYVITVCDRARESCPIFPEALNVRHWSFEDPAAAPPETQRVVFCRVRDEIMDRLCQFLVEEGGLTPDALQCYRC
jgi:arsenate reductase